MPRPSALVRGVPFALLLACVASCASGEKSTPVRGRLLQDGNPLKVNTAGLPPGEKGIRVQFIPVTAGSIDRASADVNAGDGTFTVPGPKGKGIPPGKYRISVETGAFGKSDQFRDQFSGDKSPLVVDVPEGKSVTVEVDVGKKTATVVP